MIHRLLITAFLCVFTLIASYSQGIRGRITNERGEAIPFANIYVAKLSTGTASNIEGNYELKLPNGTWEVLFQYLGYKSQTRMLTIGPDFQELNIQLETQHYRIPEIKILASGENPAYYIMRRAIAMAPYYRKQVSKYSCKVYLKGSGVMEKIPSLLKKQMKKSGVKENEPVVIETVSAIDFELPDKLKQRVLAMRSSGEQNNTSPMSYITTSLYDTEQYGIVSPVGKNALKVYNFFLDGVFEDQGRTINKIRVMPKIEGKDVFSGHIYIADLFWNIHSADLTMQMPMISARVHQLYGEVNKNTWMPVSFDFDMNVAGLGLKMKYKYVASLSEYKTTLNPSLDHTFLENQKNRQLMEQMEEETVQASIQKEQATKEQKRINSLLEKKQLSNHETIRLNKLIEKEARRNSPPAPLEIKSGIQVSRKQENNDSAYWSTLRPIPLTEKENLSFAQKDSFLRLSATPRYQDSIKDLRRKFKVKHLITGKRYDYSIDSISLYQYLSIPQLTDPSSLSFNSVDGLRLALPFSYTRADSSGHFLKLAPRLAYAFARQKLDASISYRQRLNGMTNIWVGAGMGSMTEDYNRKYGLSSLANDIYTLWREENHKRFYQKDFVELNVSHDLFNGLNIDGTVEYSNNSRLSNHSTYHILDRKDREIQPNIPVNNSLQYWQLDNHQSLISRFQLEYTPRYRYMVRNHAKIYATSKYPTFSLGYDRAYDNVMGSDSRFDLLELGIKHTINFAISDIISWQVNTGKFINKDELYFEDFHHFNTQFTNFLFSKYDNTFRLLPFYRYSTPEQYAEGHIQWQSRRLLLKLLPLIKNSSVSEKLFINYLSTPGLPHYIESGYGIDNVFLLLNVEGVAGFENGRFSSAAIKISLNLQDMREARQ
jgi:hypothetical protein